MPLRISNTTVVHHLQQDVENIRVRLFDFVEQHNAIRLAAHSFGELTAFIITNIAGRRTNQSSHRMLLHVFGHVEAHDIVGRVKQRRSERAG